MLGVGKEVGGVHQMKWIAPQLNNLKTADRDGLIEIITLEGIDVAILCNREAMQKKEQYNCTIQGREFYGNIIAVGIDVEADLIQSLSAKELKYIMKQMEQTGDDQTDEMSLC